MKNEGITSTNGYAIPKLSYIAGDSCLGDSIFFHEWGFMNVFHRWLWFEKVNQDSLLFSLYFMMLPCRPFLLRSRSKQSPSRGLESSIKLANMAWSSASRLRSKTWRFSSRCRFEVAPTITAATPACPRVQESAVWARLASCFFEISENNALKNITNV